MVGVRPARRALRLDDQSSYSYGKQLLAPGQRIGYLALSPRIETRNGRHCETAVRLTQLVSNYAFANALLQRALPDIADLCVDIARSWSGAATRSCRRSQAQGYEPDAPGGHLLRHGAQSRCLTTRSSWRGWQRWRCTCCRAAPSGCPAGSARCSTPQVAASLDRERSTWHVCERRSRRTVRRAATLDPAIPP